MSTVSTDYGTLTASTQVIDYTNGLKLLVEAIRENTVSRYSTQPSPFSRVIAASSNITLNATTVDGVTLSTGDTVILTRQLLASENGVYTYTPTGLTQGTVRMIPTYATITPHKHEHDIAASTWKIVHKLGYAPSILRVVTSNGIELECDPAIIGSQVHADGVTLTVSSTNGYFSTVEFADQVTQSPTAFAGICYAYAIEPHFASQQVNPRVETIITELAELVQLSAYGIEQGRIARDVAVGAPLASPADKLAALHAAEANLATPRGVAKLAEQSGD